MTTNEVIQRLREAPNRAAIARATGLRSQYLWRIASGMLKNPGARHVDALRDYFVQRDSGVPQ